MNRDHHFDNIKFLLIVLVVLGHVLEALMWTDHISKTLYFSIYTFHMPLFIFIGGYFSKNINDPNYSVKVISKLVVPYVIFEVLYSIFYYYVIDSTKFNVSFFGPYWIMWFLMCSIIWKLVLPYFTRLRYPMVLAIILAVAAGYASDVGYYLALSRAIVYFPFFLAGYYVEKRHLAYLFNFRARICSLSFLLIVILAYYFYADLVPTNTITMWIQGSYSYISAGSPEWYAGLYRIGILIISALMCASVISLVPRREIKHVSSMGQRTIYPYLIHGFIIKYLVVSQFFTYINTSIEIIAVYVATVLLTILLSTQIIKRMSGFLIEPGTGWLFGARKQRQSIDGSQTISK